MLILTSIPGIRQADQSLTHLIPIMLSACQAPASQIFEKLKETRNMRKYKSFIQNLSYTITHPKNQTPTSFLKYETVFGAAGLYV